MEITPAQPVDDATPPQASHGHHLHPGRRLKKLLRPNGRRVHIAATPEEHIHLTRYVNFAMVSSCLLSNRKKDTSVK